MMSASAHLGAGNRVFGQQRRFGMSLLEIFDDRGRLDQQLAVRRHQNRDAHLRIHRAEFRPLVVATILYEVNRQRLVGEVFQIERDAYPVSGG